MQFIKMMKLSKENFLHCRSKPLIFFCEEFTKIYPNAKIEDVADELKSQLKEEGYISIQAGEDEWGIKTYVSNPQDIQEG